MGKTGVSVGFTNEPVKGNTLTREAYKIAETAALLSLSEKSVRRLIDRGLLHAINALRHKLIPRSEIERFLRQ